MFEYALVSMGMVLFIRVFLGRLIYVETFRNEKGYVKVFGLFEYVLVCLSMFMCDWVS